MRVCWQPTGATIVDPLVPILLPLTLTEPSFLPTGASNSTPTRSASFSAWRPTNRIAPLPAYPSTVQRLPTSALVKTRAGLASGFVAKDDADDVAEIDVS